MKQEEQYFVIEQRQDFEPRHIFECGQCFRWNLEEDQSYTGVFGMNVINVKKEGQKIVFRGICQGDIKQICTEYFDLNTNYGKMKEILKNKDENLRIAIQYGEGIRILKQDVFETIISFIISANNNIPRIKKIIEKLAMNYGEEIEWNHKKYATFPTPEQLSKASIQKLRELGLGFRDKRVYETTEKIVKKQISIEQLQKEQSTRKIREQLLELPGIGPKVADCILLFGFQRYEVFPIDVWVNRVMKELYFKQQDSSKIETTEIYAFANQQYGKLAGIAQQYLFYWKRQETKTA